MRVSLSVLSVLAIVVMPLPIQAVERQPPSSGSISVEPASGVAADDFDARQPVLTTPWFTFHSHFGFNLYDAVSTSATARRAKQEDPLHEGGCFASLAGEERSAWDGRPTGAGSPSLRRVSSATPMPSAAASRICSVSPGGAARSPSTWSRRRGGPGGPRGGRREPLPAVHRDARRMRPAGCAPPLRGWSRRGRTGASARRAVCGGPPSRHETRGWPRNLPGRLGHVPSIGEPSKLGQRRYREGRRPEALAAHAPAASSGSSARRDST